jgi:sporulation protein YlmC with PRC-barrel domain
MKEVAMDIPINAQVRCADGECGRSTRVVINPVTRQVTHLVVQEIEFLGVEHLVPLDQVLETRPDLIHLRCTKDQLAKMEGFVEVEYLGGSAPYFAYSPSEYVAWPYVFPAEMLAPLEHERIPPGELTVRRGGGVEATDGHIGRVDEFLVDPQNGHITHLVLREGHLWGHKDVTIPVSEIDRIEEDTVYLKLDKHEVEALPAIPVKREWL